MNNLEPNLNPSNFDRSSLAPEPVTPELAVQPSHGPSPKVQRIVLIAAAVLFALAILWGFYSGFQTAKSKATYANAAAIAAALKYYLADQTVYPTADQFYNQRILVPFYLPNLPAPVDASGSCGPYTKFIYTQPNPNQFILEFCLTSGTAGLGSGLHAFTEKGLE